MIQPSGLGFKPRTKKRDKTFIYVVHILYSIFTTVCNQHQHQHHHHHHHHHHHQSSSSIPLSWIPCIDATICLTAWWSQTGNRKKLPRNRTKIQLFDVQVAKYPSNNINCFSSGNIAPEKMTCPKESGLQSMNFRVRRVSQPSLPQRFFVQKK